MGNSNNNREILHVVNKILFENQSEAQCRLIIFLIINDVLLILIATETIFACFLSFVFFFLSFLSFFLSFFLSIYLSFFLSFFLSFLLFF